MATTIPDMWPMIKARLVQEEYRHIKKVAEDDPHLARCMFWSWYCRQARTYSPAAHIVEHSDAAAPKNKRDL